MSIAPAEVLPFINRALDGMLHIVELLGDARLNQRPPFPNANSPYVILAHCVGLTHNIMGAVLAGRPYQRDRDAEFRAHDAVEDSRDNVVLARLPARTHQHLFVPGVL